MPKVLILTDVQQAARDRYKAVLLERFPRLSIDVVGHHEASKPHLPEMEVLMCFSPPMADHVVRDAPKLRWIQALGTGVDNIVDLPSLGREVLVTNVRGIHGAPVSEAAVAYMLALARRLPDATHAQDAREWKRWPAELLTGKTVGIFGVGLIAEYLAPICKVFGMTTVGLSSTPRRIAGFDRMVHRDDLVRAAADLDFLVALTPLTPDTRNIINARVFAAMKPTAYLVNVARGGVVDEAALVEALNSGQIAGAALDVFDKEPLPADDPIYRARNVLIYSHLGGYSEGYEERAMPTLAHNMECWLAGEPQKMMNVVRSPASWSK